MPFLASPLVLPSPAYPARYLPEHTSCTHPAPALLDEFVIDVCAIEQEHVSKGA